MRKLNPPQEYLINLMKLYHNKQYNEAEKLALLITQQFPKNQFGWKALGSIFEKQGRKLDSLKARQKVIVLSPQDPESYYNLGVTLQELDKLDEAKLNYNKAIEMKSDYAEAHNNLGLIMKHLGRLEESEVNFRKAIELKDNYFEAYINLGAMLRELGRLDEALSIYRHLIKLKPDYAEAYNNLGNTLKDLGRLDEAEINYRKAIVLKTDYAKAYNNLGVTLQELGKLKESEASYRKAIIINSDFIDAYYNLGVLLFENRQYSAAAEQFDLSGDHRSKLYTIRCSYLSDEKDIFSKKLDSLIDQGNVNAVIGSLIFCSEIKHGIKKLNPFCGDPLSYVMETDLNKLYDFENIFINTVRNVLMDSSVSYKSQGHLTNGIQTSGNIFFQDKIHKSEIESIIHNEIKKYRIHFNDSKEGFIKNWPNSYNISGWLVSMQSGGKLEPHMHDIGWLTGSIYINVPPKSKTDNGNLVLCLDDKENLIGFDKDHERIINVKTGSLCLFPSSLHHYTIPFEEEENRIVLAFDIIPTN